MFKQLGHTVTARLKGSLQNNNNNNQQHHIVTIKITNRRLDSRSSRRWKCRCSSASWHRVQLSVDTNFSKVWSPEDGGSIFFRNAGAQLWMRTTSQPRTTSTTFPSSETQTQPKWGNPAVTYTPSKNTAAFWTLPHAICIRYQKAVPKIYTSPCTCFHLPLEPTRAVPPLSGSVFVRLELQQHTSLMCTQNLLSDNWLCAGHVACTWEPHIKL
jgi:hypothetical protein